MRLTLILSLTLFCLSLSLYIYTLAPTVTFQDSGEYITSAYNLGIPHPPGNPTWCILAKLFTYLPIGSIAYRVNFMSAFFAALSVAFSFLIFKDIFFKFFNFPERDITTLSFILGLMVTIISSLWKKAVVSEVYTLNLFFMLLVIWLGIKIPEVSKKIKWLIWLGLVSGIGAGNHLSIILLFPAILIYLLNHQIKVRELFFISIGFFLGLLVYLYLPLRSLANPVPDSGNPETLANFLWVMLRKQWGGIKWMNISWLAIRHGFESMNLAREFTLAGLFLGVIGFISLFLKKRIFFVFTFSVFLFYSLGMIILLAGDLGRETFFLPSNDEFFIPVHWLYVLWLGSGTLVFMKKKKFFLFLPAVIILFSFYPHFQQSNFRNYTLAREIGTKLLEDTEKDSIILSVSDHITFILLYLQEVEGLRQDVIVLDRSLLTWPVYYDQYVHRFPQLNFPNRTLLLKKSEISSIKLVMRQFIINNISSRPIYWVLNPGDEWVEERLIPNGLTFKFSAAPLKDISPEVIREGEKKWLRIEELCLPWLDKPNHLSAEPITSGLAKQMGIYFHRKKLYDKAISYYTRAKILSPGLNTSSYNLGLIYWQRGELEKALQEFRHMIAYDPYSNEGYFRMGKVYEAMGRYPEAITAYVRSRKLAPYYADTNYHLGRCLAKEGKIALARQAYLEALRLDPNYEEARKALNLL